MKWQEKQKQKNMKKEKKKSSKFIKYKFIRVSRKKEINFLKFESQIKLSTKKSRGSCAVCNLTAHFVLSPPISHLTLSVTFVVCVL